MAALSNSTPRPDVRGIPPVTVSEPLMSLADIVAAYRAHVEIGPATASQIIQMSEDAWG